MGADTRIEWATHTFNPWRGCTKVAAGCTNCYAEAWSKRNPGTLGVWGDQGTRVVASEAQWRLPLKWAREAREREGSWHADTGIGPIRPRVFCASLADVFEDRPELVGPRARLLDLIHRTPELDWLLLTKRPENIERLWDEAATEWGEPGTLALPMSNVWLGTSIACQEDADRNIPLLLQVPAAVRFVSAEPLVGPVDLRRWLGYNPVHEQHSARRGSGVRGGPRGGLGDRRGGAGLADSQARLGSVEGGGCFPSVQAGEGRERDPDWIPASADDAGWNAASRAGSSSRLDAHPRPDSRGHGAQPQERREGGQPAGELGDRDAIRQHPARGEGRPTSCGTAARGEESGRNADDKRRTRDSASPRNRGAVGEHRGGLRDHVSDSVEDSETRPSISWVICGGESGPRARPMHPGWAVSLIEQCAAASVPCFFKQAGAVLARQYGMRHSKGGDMSEWPPTWRVREVPR